MRLFPCYQPSVSLFRRKTGKVCKALILRVTLGLLVEKPAVFSLLRGRNRKNSLFPPNSPLHRARGDRTPGTPAMAGNAPAFGSSEFQIDRETGPVSRGLAAPWPMKRLLRRGRWLCRQSPANSSLRPIPCLTGKIQGNFLFCRDSEAFLCSKHGRNASVFGPIP